MRTLLLATFLFTLTGAFSQDLAMSTAITLNGPGIAWNEQTLDLGSIEKGKTTKVNFPFTNNGTEALIIERVKTSCGCTATNYPKEPIAPGESASIEVSYKSGSPGSFAKSITVISNSSEPTSTLRIKGVVE